MNKDKNEKKFPGYPHYPESEDITNEANGLRQVNIIPSGGLEEKPENENPDPDADVSPEEKEALSAAFQNRDVEDEDAEEPLLDQSDEDGVLLNERQGSYGNIARDLDIPGNEEQDETEGNEDEENDYYSLGGDEHNDLEEDNAI